MSKFHGKSGAVYNGSNAVGEVTDFDYDESAPVAVGASMGDATESYMGGIPGGGGSLTCYYDAGDTNGQVPLVVNASVTLNLYPEGNTSGKKYLTGTALIESVRRSVSKGDLIGRTISFKGVLTEATVA